MLWTFLLLLLAFKEPSFATEAAVDRWWCKKWPPPLPLPLIAWYFKIRCLRQKKGERGKRYVTQRISAAAVRGKVEVWPIPSRHQIRRRNISCFPQIWPRDAFSPFFLRKKECEIPFLPVMSASPLPRIPSLSNSKSRRNVYAPHFPQAFLFSLLSSGEKKEWDGNAFFLGFFVGGGRGRNRRMTTAEAPTRKF